MNDFVAVIFIVIAHIIGYFLGLRQGMAGPKEPDGIIAVSEKENGKLSTNFILCIPIDDFLSRDRVIFEITHLPPDSQEIQDIK